MQVHWLNRLYSTALSIAPTIITWASRDSKQPVWAGIRLDSEGSARVPTLAVVSYPDAR